jgi:Flp pilus assembly protein TadG
MWLTSAAQRRKRSGRGNRGVAAVEFGLLAPTLVMVFAGTVTVGDAVAVQTRLDGAVAAGINYALVNQSKVSASTNPNTNNAYAVDLASAIATLVSTSAGGTAANVTVVVNNGPTVTISGGTTTTGGTTANANLYYCLTGSPSAWTWGTSATSSGGACSGSGTYGKFVTVTANYAFTPFFATYTFGLGSTITIGTAAQVQ